MTDQNRERLQNLEAEIARLEAQQRQTNLITERPLYSWLTDQLKEKYEQRNKILQESRGFWKRIDPSTILGACITSIGGVVGTWIVLNYEEKVGPATSKAFNNVFGSLFKNRRV